MNKIIHFIGLHRLSMRQSYLLALGLIMVLAAFKYYATTNLIQSNDNSSMLINLSGRQRMLSQRIALFSLEQTLAQTSLQKSNARANLKNAVDEFEKNHNSLVDFYLHK